MANQRSNSIKDTLNKGILVSLCLSTLVGSIVVAIWQGVSKVRIQSYQESLVREVIRRDASDLITSYILKNYDGVIFQMRSALEKLPVQCAYVQFSDSSRAVIGNLSECQRIVSGQSRFAQTEVSSNDISFGPLYYAVKTEGAPITSYSVLALAFLALVCSVALTWGILLYFLNRSILKPLQEITTTGLGVGVLRESDTACDELNILARELGQYREKLKSDIYREEFIKVAGQVAHDVRSPLAALSVVEQNLSALPEDLRLLVRNSVNAVQDIANSLLDKERALTLGKNEQTVAESKAQLISSLIDPIISEKRMEFRSKIGISIHSQFGTGFYGLFAKVDSVEFRRIISNLVNNSVEALGDKGTVEVSLSKNTNGEIELTVTDNGPGIPPEILAKLGPKPVSHGKEDGRGFGLSHVHSTVAIWHGRIQIKSELGKGASVHIFLPQTKAPVWFVSDIKLHPGTNVVVLDDDTSIHQIWRGRFESLKAKSQGITVWHFSRPSELREWVGANKLASQSALFLMDYELLGHTETGLDLIEEMDLCSRSILISSRVEEKAVLETCKRLSVRIIPKCLAGFVPMSFAEVIDSPEFILIDNDDLIQHMWKTAAKIKGKRVAMFSGPSEFLDASASIDKATPVYVDVNLDGPLQGDQFAKTLFDVGFTNIYLATGDNPEKYAHLEFLKGVRGKAPPL